MSCLCRRMLWPHRHDREDTQHRQRRNQAAVAHDMVEHEVESRTLITPLQCIIRGYSCHLTLSLLFCTLICFSACRQSSKTKFEISLEKMTRFLYSSTPMVHQKSISP
jgi:hypothetical protein